MYLTLVVLILLICFLLSLIVLAQNPKGGGISSQFGSGGAANLMGVKRTGDLLEKLTWGFAIGLIVITLATHMLSSGTNGPVRSINQQAAQRAVVPASAPAPATAPMSAPAPGAAPSTMPAPQPQPAQ